jgi:hypothetical protein
MTALSSKSFLNGWALWGLPAFAEIFAPWQNKITQMSLISDWFQPTLNTGASVLGPLFCFVTFAALVRAKKQVAKRTAQCGLAIFLVAMFACFLLKISLGVVIDPAPAYLIFIWVWWATLYLTLFCALGATMVAAGIAAR